jgi:2-methylcitrate dehydratase PrpD
MAAILTTRPRRRVSWDDLRTTAIRTPQISAALAAFALGLRWEDLPPQVAATARLHLLDAVGCGLAAVAVGAGQGPAHVAAGDGGRASAPLLGSSVAVPAAAAAFANGTSCHALDFDDTHEQAICHVSAVVGPAALAAGEACGRSGRDVMTAFVAGSEATVRLGLASASELYARGFHPTPVLGTFGAALASARLLGLSEKETVSALGIAGSFAAGLLEFLGDGSDVKPVHAGWAAQAGVRAAELARAGVTGPVSVVEGRFGLFASHAGASADAAAVLDGLGSRWHAADVAFKPYPLCHFAHAPVAAVSAVAAERGFTASEVAEIVVAIPSEGLPLVLDPIELKRRPRTPYEAKFSLPWAIGRTLVHGSIGVDAFTAEAVADEAVLDVAARVAWESWGPDPPPSRFAGRALVTLRDGTSHGQAIDHTPGSPGNPLTAADIGAKFAANAALLVGEERAAQLGATLLALDELPVMRLP